MYIMHVACVHTRDTYVEVWYKYISLRMHIMDVLAEHGNGSLIHMVANM